MVALPFPQARKVAKEKLSPPHQIHQKANACVHQQRIKGHSVAGFIDQAHRLG
jgi:hypothetical protein